MNSLPYHLERAVVVTVAASTSNTAFVCFSLVSQHQANVESHRHIVQLNRPGSLQE